MRFLPLILCLLTLCLFLPVRAQETPETPALEWQHGLTLFGDPKYRWSFKHFRYANPNAPKGGTLKLANPATFDSLNDFILKGVKAPGLGMLYDSLMTASLDEPQSYYPLVAESFRIAPDRSWMEFRIRRRARWHDGKPITPDDIVWTLNTLKTEGDPVYRLSYAPLARAEKIGRRTVRFVFTDAQNREAPLLAASMPILPKHYYQTTEFNKTTLTPPLGSGAYRVGALEVGRYITFERVKDYWARGLPVNRGRHNFDTLRYDVYRDDTVALEAFKAGEYDFRREYVARNWATAYNSPAIADGRIIKTELPSELPQGMQGFYFNLRQPYLSDWRMREAIALTMDFEWTNKALFYDAYKRNRSFFQYTPFEAKGIPQGRELELLEPFRDVLPPPLFTEPFVLPVTDGSGQNRTNLLKAQALLEQAGYTLQDGKRIDPATGEPVRIEFMLQQATMLRVIMPMLKGLEKLGIDGAIRLVDDAQYQRRLETRDFDIVSGWLNLGVFFPGIEQINYWHSSQADIEGSNNITGLALPAVDTMLEKINAAHKLKDLTPAARALDRILLWEHIAVPHWHSSTFRIAWWDKFGKPRYDPPYGLALDTWWAKK